MSTLRLFLLLIALAGLDLTGTICIKEASLHRQPLLIFAAVGCFVLVATLLYVALGFADMSLVSLGWIVMFQAVIMGVDHVFYDVRLSGVQVVATIVALGALAVVVFNPPAPTQPPIPGPRKETDAWAPSTSSTITSGPYGGSS